ARTRLWREIGESAGVKLAEADAAHLARLVPVAPALAASALRAAKLAGGGAETARLVASGVAHAIFGRRAPAAELEPPALYDPALVNADTDLLALADRLAAPGAPRAISLLLAGPPGAGKTAWARHLAERLGLPVLQKRASDILDPYVGGTERAIAEAFAEAREMAAFLLFDEADSLLFERGEAVRSWEITQVNEMLSAMEAHDLPFACTTNLSERLDRASLRRFLLKIRFEWMTPAQARAAFRRFFACEPPAALDGLRCLTPADFALVARRAALSGESEPDDLVRLLAAESAGRRGGRGPMGFAASVAA
ncbi:MAG: ATP-binding protein, partial [Acidibrevibacterium sp.]|uniref:ATP-binding protein n=1 Tax=Acidibrevibacterium sp. TaxID=2606776 RepID=UPI003D03519B